AWLPTIDVSNATTGHTDSFPVGAIAYVSGTADVTGAMQGVDSTHGLPVNVLNSSLAVTQSGSWSLAPHQSTNVDQIGGSALALGQSTMANSIPVVLASNQSTIVVSGSGTFTIAGTVTTNADTTIGGTSAPAKGLLVIGKTNDGTPQYQPLPEGTGGRSVIVEGYAGGTAVPVSIGSTVTVAGSGTFAVTQSGTWTIATNADAAIGAGSAPSKALAIAGVYNSSLPSPTSGQTVGIQLDSSGRLLVGSIAGTVAATQSGSWVLAPHQSTNVDQIGGTTTDTNSGTKSAGTLRVVLATDQPALTNNLGYMTPAPAGVTTGATPFLLAGSANSTNATSVNASACTLWEIVAVNVSTSAMAYLKIYDKASSPTVGTDTPVYVLPLSYAASASGGGGGASKTFPVGLKLANGLAYAITGGMGNSDTTAVASNQVLLSGTYK
ncbi:MAG TPA: hypothetical protein VGX78_07225, partial [Pirellulales bacterium]|nr:hypothetical protein [Pirellulales bacterium]